MKTFIKILRIAAFPLLIVVFIIFALQKSEPIKKIKVADTLFKVVESGRMENNIYINQEIGFKIMIPETEFGQWSMNSFDNEFYHDNQLLWINQIEHEIFELNNKDDLTIIDIRIEYIDNKKIKDNDEASKFYTAFRMGRLMRHKASPWRQYCTVSDYIPTTINSNTFYTVTLVDNYWGNSITYYSIRHKTFGFSITFYNRNLDIEPEYSQGFIMKILESVELMEPEIKYE